MIFFPHALSDAKHRFPRTKQSSLRCSLLFPVFTHAWPTLSAQQGQFALTFPHSFSVSRLCPELPPSCHLATFCHLFPPGPQLFLGGPHTEMLTHSVTFPGARFGAGAVVSTLWKWIFNPLRIFDSESPCRFIAISRRAPSPVFFYMAAAKFNKH